MFGIAESSGKTGWELVLGTWAGLLVATVEMVFGVIG
jgi:hypothetical protein